MTLQNYLRIKKWSTALKVGVPTMKASSIFLGDWNTVRQTKKKLVTTIKVTCGDTEYFTLMNANTVPKLPNSCLFLTLQLLCSIKARAPSKNPPPFACLFFPSG